MRRSPRISDVTAAWTATAVLLAALGWVLWRTISDQPAAVTGHAAGFLNAYADQLRPERRERLVFIALVAAFPVLTAAVVAAIQWLGGFRRSSAHFDSGVALAVCLAAVWLVVRSDDLTQDLAMSRRWTIALAVSTAVLTITAAWAPSFRLRGRFGLLACCSVAAVLTTFAWRVFGVATPSSPDFYYISHLEAFVYSVVQIRGGGTCLADVVPQYGCYGELLAPLWALFGSSLVSLTVILAIAQSIALIAIHWFAARLIRDPLLFVCAAVTVAFTLNRIGYESLDPYFQYTPLRVLCPALSLLAALGWQRRKSAAAAGALGLFAALSVVVNLDAGAVVLVALGAFVLFSGARTASGGASGNVVVPRRLSHFGLFLLAAFAGIVASGLILSWKAGRWIDPLVYVLFQRLFFDAGFMMLPMPEPPHAWMAVPLLASACLVPVVMRRLRASAGRRDELAAYVALLGIGLFIYYVGRSHWKVLILGAWPLLLVFFHLLDRAIWRRDIRTSAQAENKTGASIAPATGETIGAWTAVVLTRGLAVLLLLSVLAQLAQHRAHIIEDVRTRWSELVFSGRPAIAQDAAFIRANTAPGEPIGLLSIRQATTLLEARRASAFTGPGLWELLTRAQRDHLLAQLASRRVRHLFIDRALIDQQVRDMSTEPWLREAMPLVVRSYRLESWGPGGRLMHLVSRDGPAGNDLFAWKHPLACDPGPGCDGSSFALEADPTTGLLLGAWRQPFDLPLATRLSVPVRGFELEMRIVPARDEPPQATLIASASCCATRGFAVQRSPLRPDGYVVALGTASGRLESPAFMLPAGVESRLAVSADGERLHIAVDGRTVSETDSAAMASDDGAIIVGAGQRGGQRFSGAIHSLHLKALPH